jgi:hypothetical protein
MLIILFCTVRNPSPSPSSTSHLWWFG